jgi:hypothetical protein
MNNPTLEKNQHRNLLKGIALIIGYIFWYIFGASHAAVVTLSVPLCFYNMPAQTAIHAPESISIKVAGKRSDIRAVDREHLAIHIDASQLQKGNNLLNISKKELLLPNSIKLVQYFPSNPTVELLPQENV